MTLTMLWQWLVLTYRTSGTLNAEAILNFWIMYIFSETQSFVLRPWFPSFPLKLTGSTKNNSFFCPQFWWGPSVCQAILFKSTCRNPRFTLLVLSLFKNPKQTNQRKNVIKCILQNLTSPPLSPLFFLLGEKGSIYFEKKDLSVQNQTTYYQPKTRRCDCLLEIKPNTVFN